MSTNILYIVFVERGDTAISGNQQKLINKASHPIKKHVNYESTIRIQLNNTLSLATSEGKDLASFQAAMNRINRKIFQDDLKELAETVASMYANGGIGKVVTRGHGSPTSYAGMSPKCVAELLRHVGIDACKKIDLTGCNLGIGPGITQAIIGMLPANVVGKDSFAQRFQLEMYENSKDTQERCYTVHARTSIMTVNEDGRKEIKLANGQYKNKALRDKIVFSINQARIQTMDYPRDFNPLTSKMCPLCREENPISVNVCSSCGQPFLP
jgi:hypothetical protein